jgi:hypothetical protein
LQDEFIAGPDNSNISVLLLYYITLMTNFLDIIILYLDRIVVVCLVAVFLPSADLEIRKGAYEEDSVKSLLRAIRNKVCSVQIQLPYYIKIHK